MAKTEKESAYRTREPRYPLRLRAVYRPVGRPRAIEGWTRNISGRGLLLELREPVQAGTWLRLRLELPLPSSGGHVLMDCLCRVVRVLKEGRRRAGVAAMVEHYEPPADQPAPAC